jgi:acetyl esterase/lipase
MRLPARIPFLLLLFSPMVLAQSLPPQIALPERILLWPNGAPGAQGDMEADKPDLTVYPVNGSQKVPTGVVVLPGGSYRHLAVDHEGVQIAAWLNTYGITAFVVRYRLGPKYHHPIELGDAQRAIRWARAHSSDYGINPHQLGVWGFSAGGHLASSAGTHFDDGKTGSADPIDRQNCRPDFLILGYPVITLKEPFVHHGSLHSLLGENPDPALVNLLSNETQVTKDTPPAFLFHTSDDETVDVQNSVHFYLALQAAHVPAEMHIFEHGKHGVGLARDNPELSVWTDLLAAWLKHRGVR